MESRKQKEVEYYDNRAKKWLSESSEKEIGGDFEGFEPLSLSSYKFCYKLLAQNCPGKKVLDYGCGNGIHSIFLAKSGAGKVVAIDLSQNSLEIAQKRAKKEEIKNIEFLSMDCEEMTFPGNSFDVIFDGGTFSSLDLKLVYPELARILRPDGRLIGIETFGHNPLTNLKRKINRATGKRTEWATEHIFRKEDLKRAENYFNKVEVKYFHLVSWMVFPFLGFPGGKFLLKILEAIDRVLFIFPFLRKYAFKVVFLFSNPKK